MADREHREAADQRAFFRWLRTRYITLEIPPPQHLLRQVRAGQASLDAIEQDVWETRHIPLGEVAYHPANGGFRNAREGARLKAEGVLAGVSDIVVPVPARSYHGLYIELKVGNETPTDKQIRFMEHMRALRYYAIWVTGWESARQTTEWYLEDHFRKTYGRSNNV